MEEKRYETLFIPNAEVHETLARYPGWEAECKEFWSEPEIVEKTVPLLVAGVTLVCLEFLGAEGSF